MEKIDKKNLQKKFTQARGIFSNITKDYQTDWLIILILSVALVIGNLSFGIFIRENIDSKINRQQDLYVDNVSFDIESYANIFEEFHIKKQKTEEYKKGYVGPRDPSI